MTVVNSFLAGNTTAGLVNWTNSGAVFAENNWWGNPTGPANGTNPGGLGAVAYGNVDFSPWLGYGTDTDLVAMGFQPDLGTVLYKPVSLAFSVQPVGANLGALFLTQPQVTISNEVGGVATQYNGSVSIVIANNPGLGTLNGALTVPVVAGVATFTDLFITVGGGSGFTLAASSASPIVGATSEVFDIANPRPVLSSMSPIFIAQGSAQFLLTVNGSSFVPTSKVMWGGSERATTFVSAGQLTAVIPATDVASAGTAPVTVFTPAAGGGTSETSLTFNITASALAPVVYVDDDWTGYGACGGHVWGYDAFKTIQEGVNAVAEDGTVNVLAGTYFEKPVINKAIKLIGVPGDAAAGPGANAPIIDGNGNGTVITITANGVTAEGFVIQHSGVTAVDAGIKLVNVSGCSVNDNTCTLNAVGVAVIMGSGNAVSRNISTANGGYGIVMIASTGNTIGQNAVSANGLDAIALDNASPVGGSVTVGSTGNSIIGNTISSNRDGLFLGENCDSNQVTGGNVIASAAGIGISLWRSDGQMIIGNEITSAATGIRLLGSSGNTISGNTIVNNGKGVQVDASWQVGVWYQSENNSISDNNLAGNTGGIVFGVEQTAKVNASGNWWGTAVPADVKTAANGGALVDYSPWLAVGTDTDEGALGFNGDFSSLWVDDDSVQVGATTRIQEGVNLVSSSGTVNVLAGTYRERVVLNKPITVLGDPGDLTAGPGVNAPILDGDLDNNGTPDKGDGFTIPRNSNLSGITVEGFIIQNFSNGIPSGGNGVGVGVISWENTSSHVTIQDNEFRNLGYNGVYVGTDSDDMQSDWLVQRNVVTGAPYAGIELTDVRNSQVLNNVITAPTTLFPDAGDAGVGIEIAARSRVGLVAVTNILVQGNTISGVFASGSRAGINLLARAYNSGSADALLSGITVLANVVTGSGTRGIDVVAESRNGKPSRIENLSITQNDFSGNATGIQLGDAFTAPKANGTYDVGTITIQNNNLAANTVSGLSNLSSVSVIAERNWFGSITGPLNVTNPGGTGSAVVGPVDFSPWLGDGTDTLADIGFQPNTAPVYYLPVSLHFSTPPGGALLGALLAPQPIVVVSNEVGGVAEQFNGNIALAIGVNPGTPRAGELTGAATLTVTNGFATFSDIAITLGTGNGYTLVASTIGLDSVSSATFDILNSEPVLTTPIVIPPANEQALLTFTATATDTPADLASQTLTFSLTGTVPPGASITSGGLFAWEPTEEQGGASYTFTVVVTDNGTGSLFDSETITITVAEVNVAPMLPAISDQTVNEQGTLSFTVPTASDQDLPAQTLIYTLDAASLAAGMTIDGSTGAFSWSPSESQGGTDYNVTVTVTDNGLNLPNLTDAKTFKITVPEINVAPVLAPIPPQSVNFGQTLTFTASATDQDRVPTQTLTFTLTDAPAGAAIDPATGVFTWTPTAAQAKQNYSFTVKVTDNGSPAMSDEQLVTIGAISASHTCPGYRSPSTSMVVSNRFDFGGTPDGLTWTPVLPNANWIITAADAGGNGVAEVINGTAVVFTTLPITSPVVFSYTVSVPGDQAVSNSLGAAVSFNGLTVDVAPIAIYRYHSADYRADVSGTTIGQFRKIDSTEINRVLAYWRYGYKPDSAGLDGFVATSGYAGQGGRHSADYDETPWQIDTDEAALVLEYWRQGGYHADPDGEDGYASTRTGPGPSLLMFSAFGMDLLLPPATTVNGPVAYNPGKTVTVTNTFFTGSTEKLSYFTWNLRVPGGWRVTGVSGDGSPLLDPTGTSVLLSAQTLPTTEVRLVVTYSVPLNAFGACEVGAEARYKFNGMVRALTLSADPLLALGALDANSDGLADTWAATYGITDPTDDEDGDLLSEDGQREANARCWRGGLLVERGGPHLHTAAGAR
jgi:parallel beta-helix repeat protein